ncbi:MAG: hypothetical protein NWR67_07175 [Saprospiraceae bacterium]|jgi:tetratricopeptide (TPR) repeat protein|nr:hypothetical protein [Saprospiraceae bacterium]MDP4820770.1 hypothetical protein [Saprospiraceae bacterium]MDP5000047.1 hypothetical protein [Saprospiraceae bacterium]
MKKYAMITGVLAMLALSCSPKEAPAGENEAPERLPEAIGLNGTVYFAPEDSPEAYRQKDSLLNLALRDWQADTTRVENLIWYGRRVAYMGRYNEAIDIFSDGLARFPGSAELYRHRGHRYLTIRQTGKAIQDFEQAARIAVNMPVTIEPDGLPNKLNIPLSNLQFNIYYHWALAHYLRGEFDRAAELFENCQLYANNPDLIVAVTDWLYMTYRRLGRETEAAALLELIYPGMEIIENDAYFNRLLMYAGQKEAAELLNLDPAVPVSDKLLTLVTQGYGVGNWYLYNGDTTQAIGVFQQMLETAYWPAFGYLAAEAELSRLGSGK